MRLLDTRTFEFREFYDSVPRYAILSHRWVQEEVSYRDVETGRHQSLRGWIKIRAFCALASSRRLSYAWVDTCCIDKSSSAEQMEAINSMYRWYENAEECYVYLSDVRAPSLNSREHQTEFAESAWFTRGWTLQELIAPSKVFFYNYRWDYLGSRDTMYVFLGNISGVDVQVLSKKKQPHECTISQRMSWAARRVTSRLEDRAYSLLGIFNVNMPMLYGEGEKAFRRLQQEVINQSDDHTIFAWGSSSFAKTVLAPAPDCFRGLENLMRIHPTNDTTLGFSFVNAGLSIQLHLIPWAMNTYLAPLRCGYFKHQGNSTSGVFFRGYNKACIFLQQTEHDNQFVRVSVGGRDLKVIDGDDLAQMREQFDIQLRHILVKQPNLSDLANLTESSFYGFKFNFKHPKMFDSGSKPTPVDMLCGHVWQPNDPVFEIKNGRRHTAGILRLSGYPGLYLYLGFDLDFGPLCLITSQTPHSSERQRFSILPDFTLISKTQADQLLDLNWLRFQVLQKTQAHDTILAFKGERNGRTQIECQSLSLRLTFGKKYSRTVGKQAWCVTFEYIRPTSPDKQPSRDVTITPRDRPTSYIVAAPVLNRARSVRHYNG
ncbi:hypothetical protein PV08_10791 [Exophiala spinifera]|uniref:Uncharacterized protein n=1 Tax=Exophiala spinifera TaxID=91928 RepID=A0A0D1Y951_9EURO|nr:uncharacterized protein PV08_10791 [Exophiala spinifera]KIW11491.1 hypothetical protein PV08_10791 [Exophiala spinifera]